MKRVAFFLINLTLCVTLYSHPWKPSHYVIIDTDAGIDDMRAITMLLASPDVRVLGIIVSPGALSAENAYIKVKSLLNSFHHEGIPVGINRTSNYKSEEFPIALQTKWGDETVINPGSAPDYIIMTRAIIAAEKTKISFICLGSMSTAYNLLRKIPGIGTQVKDFIWSADGSGDRDGFNYNIDKNSSVGILRQEIPVKIVRKLSMADFYNEELINMINKVGTPYGKKVSEFFGSEKLKEHNFSFAGTDEMAAIFLHNQDLFINKTLGNVSDCVPSDPAGLRECMIKILSGETAARNQVIKVFPSDPLFYFEDIQGSVNEIINKYGTDEWSSGVLANELHRHLGVFAIVGVKMGIRAREYFNTGVDEFTATSFAGSVPPLSCMNDGLQVSTGATPGHGLLTVLNNTPSSPVAEFQYMDKKIRLTLKPEIAEKISSELKEINYIYGLDSNIYWELVRKNSIRYWLSIDRHDAFTIEELN